jgi:hypothetical protein
MTQLPRLSLLTRSYAVASLILLGLSTCSAYVAATRRIEDFVSAPDGTIFSGKLNITPCSTSAVTTCVYGRSFFVPIVNGYLDADLSPEPIATFFHVQYLSSNQELQWEEAWALPASGLSYQIADIRINTLASDRADRAPRTPQTSTPQMEFASSSAGRTDSAPVTPASYKDRTYTNISRAPDGDVETLPSNSRRLAPAESVASDMAAPESSNGLSRSTAGLTEANVTGLMPDLQARVVVGPGFVNSRAAVINDSGGIEAAVGNPTNCVTVSSISIPCASPVFVDAEAPAGLVNAVNTVFVLSGVPLPPASLHLFRNGIFQSVGVDYTLNVSSITFINGVIPQSGDILVASYRQ